MISQKSWLLLIVSDPFRWGRKTIGSWNGEMHCLQLWWSSRNVFVSGFCCEEIFWVCFTMINLLFLWPDPGVIFLMSLPWEPIEVLDDKAHTRVGLPKSLASIFFFFLIPCSSTLSIQWFIKITTAMFLPFKFYWPTQRLLLQMGRPWLCLCGWPCF